MHADYFSPIKSRIRIFSDKIEFFNPGSYPKPIEYFLHTDVSMPRNPILARLFRAVKLAENSGYGFDKMIDGWKEYSTKKIDFLTDLDTSTTRFYFPTPQATPQATPQEDKLKKIVTFCKEARSMKEIMQYFGLKDKNNFRVKYLNILLNSGEIELTIPDKPKSPNQKYIATKSHK
jgi:predicted HTH transcriptional regulator